MIMLRLKEALRLNGIESCCGGLVFHSDEAVLNGLEERN